MLSSPLIVAFEEEKEVEIIDDNIPTVLRFRCSMGKMTPPPIFDREPLATT
jgi:hypothetical protein